MTAVVEYGFQVCVDDRVPLLFIHTYEQGIARYSGIVHQYVQPTKESVRCSDRLPGGIEVGGVGLIAHSPASHCAYLGHDCIRLLFAAEKGDGHVCAFRSEFQGYCPAYAAAAPGNQGVFTIKKSHI